MADYFDAATMNTLMAFESIDDANCWDFIQVGCQAVGLDLADWFKREDCPFVDANGNPTVGEAKTDQIVSVACDCTTEPEHNPIIKLLIRSGIVMLYVSDTDVIWIEPDLGVRRQSAAAIIKVSNFGEGPAKSCHVHVKD